MGLSAGTIALIGLATSTVGTAASVVQGQRASRAQEEQAEKVSAQNAAKEIAARRQALRAERVRRARLTSEAEALGISGSSSALSGVGLSGTQVAEQLSQVGSAAAGAQSLSGSQQAIASAQSRQQLFSNVAALGSTVFQSAGGFDAFGGDGSPDVSTASKADIKKFDDLTKNEGSLIVPGTRGA